jgi:Protein of unknown function (DUF5661)
MPLLQLAEVLEKTAALQAADASGRLLAHRFSKVSADDSGKEPARRDLAAIMVHKWKDHIPGGLAEGKKPSDFPAEDLVKGMTVEMEHTNDPEVACEIAMDHLTEKPNYYRTGDMAKEVEEDLEKVEDGAITLAKKAGVLVAQMSKEALFNPLPALKGAATNVAGKLGKLARPPVGSVASPGVAVKRFGMGKALGVGALGLGAYGAMKAIPAVARKIEQTSSMPLAYGGGWSPTPYGYGSTPYGSGVQTMGPGA